MGSGGLNQIRTIATSGEGGGIGGRDESRDVELEIVVVGGENLGSNIEVVKVGDGLEICQFILLAFCHG